MMAQDRSKVHIRHVITPCRDFSRRLDVLAQERVAVDAFAYDTHLG